MSLLGNIWVKLGLKSEDFNTGMSSAEKRAERFGSFLGKVSARVVLGWAAIGAAIAKITRASIQNYQTQEAANIKLQNALRNTGAAIGTNYEELKDYASQLQKVNGYADDATMSAMATLTTFRSVQGKVFKDTIAAAQDMATFLGTDLNSAVLQLGKALEAPETGITMLRRSGVIFTTEMTENIKRLTKEGKNYEAQLLILEEVNKRFGGEAARQADTAAGAWKRVGMAFGDLTEHIGSASGVTKDLARGLAESLEYADKIISSDRLTGWQKFIGVLGMGREKIGKILEEETAEREAQAQSIQRHVQTVMDGVNSEAKAREKLAKQQEMYDEAVSKGWTERANEAQAAIGALNNYIAKSEEEAKTAAEEAKKKADALKKWREEHTGLLNELKDEIAAKEKLLNMATDRTEINRLQEEIKLLKTKREYLESGQDLRTIAPVKGVTVRAEDNKSAAMDKDLIRQSWDEVLDVNQKALEKVEAQRAQAEDIAEGFSDALRQGIISSLDELAEAIGSGNWDTSALVKAIVTPLADAAISAGVLIMTTGEGLEALKNAFESWFSEAGPYAAIVAGAALVAIGTAAKAGIAAIASGAKGTAGGGAYTYTGGYGVDAQNMNVGQMEIAGTVTVKGQDLQIALDNYNKNKGR